MYYLSCLCKDFLKKVKFFPQCVFSKENWCFSVYIEVFDLPRGSKPNNIFSFWPGIFVINPFGKQGFLSNWVNRGENNCGFCKQHYLPWLFDFFLKVKVMPMKARSATKAATTKDNVKLR